MKLMALLYDKLVLFIPPLPKDQIEKRFFLTWEELVTLCQHSIVIPIIGDAQNYTEPYFEELFTNLPAKPASLWARGLSLLDVLDMDDALNEARQILPMEALSQDEGLLAKAAQDYKTRDLPFLREIIRDDVAVMYADLCIFGCRQEAISLLSQSPREIYQTLKLLNEIKTYPVLFGLESQGNFDSCKIEEISTISVQMHRSAPDYFPQNDLEILYRGIGVDVDAISVHDIIRFHNDHLGEKVREALRFFNDYCDQNIVSQSVLDSSQVLTRAELFQKRLNEAVVDLNTHGYYHKLDKAEACVEKLFKIGAVTFGLVFAFDPSLSRIVSVASLAASGGIVISAMPETVANLVVRSVSDEIYSPFVSNMWQAKKIVDNK